jgi:hypothetical protein
MPRTHKEPPPPCSVCSIQLNALRVQHCANVNGIAPQSHALQVGHDERFAIRTPNLPRKKARRPAVTLLRDLDVFHRRLSMATSNLAMIVSYSQK